MRSEYVRRLSGVILVTLLGLITTPALHVPAAAQGLEPPQSAQIEIPPPTLRSMDDMLLDQATKVPPSAPEGGIPFRPVMAPAEYEAAKAAAAAAPRLQIPTVPAAPSPALVVGPRNCDGITQTGAGGAFPPDTDGAVGVSQYVQTTNIHVTVWDKAGSPCPDPFTNPQLDIDLNSFFGYIAQVIFDARVVHDDTYSRWVISGEAFPEGGPLAPQLHFIGVSLDEDATGPYFVFAINTRGFTCSTCLWDFPQLGMDENALILTANIFNPNFVGSRWVFLNKQRMYYGLGLVGTVFFGGIVDLPNWTPPKVLDLNSATWLLSSPIIGSGCATSLQLAALTGTNQIPPVFLSAPTVSVPLYCVPPNAPQPGTNQVIETLDARFQNRSTQAGFVLWNVQSINSQRIPFAPGLSTPLLRRIVVSTTPPTVQSAGFFAAIDSSDFNPSVAANFANTIAVTWSSTNVGAGINAQVRVGACGGAAAVCSPGGGLLVFQSSTPLLGNPKTLILPIQRWGDYSYIAIDPTNGSIAWGVNEEINNPDDSTGSTWGTRLFNASIP